MKLGFRLAEYKTAFRINSVRQRDHSASGLQGRLHDNTHPANTSILLLEQTQKTFNKTPVIILILMHVT
jgi:hypothetical protein